MPRLLETAKAHAPILLRFIGAGIIGTAVHFGVLALFFEVFDFTVIPGTTISFITAWSVSFLLQKHWTFQNNDHERLIRQILSYVAIAVLNIFVNALLMHIFVNELEHHYLLGQLFTTAIIAAESFVLYRLVVFPQKA